MASIFTYDSEHSRVSSPWLTPSMKPPTPKSENGKGTAHVSGLLADYAIDRLPPEPQEGPIEYKLHLLLRPRRNYVNSTTGSRQHEDHPQNQPLQDPAPSMASTQHRQNRLASLSTQSKMLWRLQQSSPYHASASTDLVTPQLLEGSRGALYEIGVSDDGTFIGLTKEEMEESLTTLNSIALSLGCSVEILRQVEVGKCEYERSDHADASTLQPPHFDVVQHISKLPQPENIVVRHEAKLFVAEALVLPDLETSNRKELDARGHPPAFHDTSSSARSTTRIYRGPASNKATQQLRVTLTGPTTSGKSSLLGTLSTATLDDSQGTVRLSLLKHRHEIISGVTSSIAQELVGYNGLDVVNYATDNVSSWTDIHSAVYGERLILFSDCPGYLKHRRTIMRGLVGWAPHWTLLCIAADDELAIGIDLARAHLDLCLKLDQPLVVVITKTDLATNSSLRYTISKVLSAVKAAGRTPSIIPPTQVKSKEVDLTSILTHEETYLRDLLANLGRGLTSLIPIVVTSVMDGRGIQTLHALLKNLPVPPAPSAHDYVGNVLNPEQPSSLFHIEEVFGLAASYQTIASAKTTDDGVVIAGHVRFGDFSVGDTIVVGPFPADSDINVRERGPEMHSSPSSFGASRHARLSASITKGEWQSARIVSLRNLRLPVRTLEAGQVGTIGMVFKTGEEEAFEGPFERAAPGVPHLRKGKIIAVLTQHMLDTGLKLQAASRFTASFEDEDINSVTPGSLVVVYVASIRVSARITKLIAHTDTSECEGLDDVFGVGSHPVGDGESHIFGSNGIIDVTFELLTNREWIELGSRVLITPGGGPGLYSGSERGEKGVAGLEGFVGRVIEVAE